MRIWLLVLEKQTQSLLFGLRLNEKRVIIKLTEETG